MANKELIVMQFKNCVISIEFMIFLLSTNISFRPIICFFIIFQHKFTAY